MEKDWQDQITRFFPNLHSERHVIHLLDHFPLAYWISQCRKKTRRLVPPLRTRTFFLLLSICVSVFELLFPLHNFKSAVLQASVSSLTFAYARTVCFVLLNLLQRDETVIAYLFSVWSMTSYFTIILTSSKCTVFTVPERWSPFHGSKCVFPLFPLRFSSGRVKWTS